tara:strand:- start:188 stop:424 length:237 start_codon:yes stop_codon:yes gene_type:complete
MEDFIVDSFSVIFGWTVIFIFIAIYTRLKNVALKNCSLLRDNRVLLKKIFKRTFYTAIVLFAIAGWAFIGYTLYTASV